MFPEGINAINYLYGDKYQKWSWIFFERRSAWRKVDDRLSQESYLIRLDSKEIILFFIFCIPHFSVFCVLKYIFLSFTLF